MTAKNTVAIVLVALGLMALAYQGISYTKKEQILDVGPIEATTETTETIPLPPIIGAAAICGGLILLVAGRRSSV